MTDDTHDANCGCFEIPPPYTQLAPATESNPKRVVTIRQNSELLSIALSEVSFTVTSVKSNGTGSSDVCNPFLAVLRPRCGL